MKSGLKGGESGYVHSVESAGMLDGPGVRFVAFLSGCPLHCAYCHNPDAACMTRGEIRWANDVLHEIRNCLTFIRRGGVTLSGGEPVMQPAFAKRLLRGCKEMELHTAMDTTGYLGDWVDDEMMANTDLWLLDIKSFIPEIYKRVTGVNVQPTLDFARRLSDLGKSMWIRFVLVPGLTDSPDNVAGIADFAATLGNSLQRVEVLPFHKMGEYKWREMNKAYTLTNTQPPTTEETEACRETFRQRGLMVY